MSDSENLLCGSQPVAKASSALGLCFCIPVLPREFFSEFILGWFCWSGHVIMIPSPWKSSKEVGEQRIAVLCCFTAQIALNN